MKQKQKQTTERKDCQWFALCDRKATTTRPHPILGNVLICARCNAKMDALAGARHE